MSWISAPVAAPRKNKPPLREDSSLEDEDSPYMNLSELINSVERDIWVLEQLENKSRTRHPWSLDMPVVTTEEILNLPGYKPKNKPLDSRAPAAPPLVKSFNEGPSSPVKTPPAPVQIKRRRASDNDNDDSRINDMIHHRLLPKGNAVTNVLYARRLPSPPIVRKEEENRRLYCPLCAQPFGYVFGLECHLLSVHYEDLKLLKDGDRLDDGEFIPRLCPVCRAQFLKEGLVVRHLVVDHPDFVTKIVNSSPNSDLNCRFCDQKFLHRHLRLFMIHLEQKHTKDLEGVIRDQIYNEARPPAENIYESPCFITPPKRGEDYLDRFRDENHHYYEIDSVDESNSFLTLRKKVKRIDKNNEKRKSAELIDLLRNTTFDQKNSKTNNYGNTPFAPKTKQSYVRSSIRRKIFTDDESTYKKVPQPDPFCVFTDDDEEEDEVEEEPGKSRRGREQLFL
ncbi:unnamed protein product [Lepeophtheirus salmonis]|uniref:(salmon louse) hypothetical protein n=1 Tax=Lepeophtheirus salmonis TaxID=72036 RepID=A0A7R8CW96_LEPSM|nr:unnamed protein product [Lepeophtheirus salmonis]CAF2950085.1 unnamed protein product [Lepeophtheirus salmonis]